MSRSALARSQQRQIANGSAIAGADPFDVCEAYAPDESQLAVAMHIHGNERTLNLDGLLARNIVSSNYFRQELLPMSSLDELIDEIYTSVTHVEPWDAGAARVASKCFCCLFRLGVMRPGPKDITRMLNHPDSPFIRAVAFLFLRLCCAPPELWAWLAPYVDDDSEIHAAQGTMHATTVGEWIVAHLLSSDNRYYMTVLPRLPVAVARDVGVQLLLLEKDAARAATNAKHVELLTPGVSVRARYSEDGKWYDARIDGSATARDCVNFKQKYWVTYTETESSELRSLGQIDMSTLLPAGARVDAIPERVAAPAVPRGEGRGGGRRSRSRSRDRDAREGARGARDEPFDGDRSRRQHSPDTSRERRGYADRDAPRGAYIDRDAPRGGYVDRDAPRGGYIDRDAPRGGYVDRDAPRGGYVDRDAPRGGYIDRDAPRGGYVDRDAPRGVYIDRDAPRGGYVDRDAPRGGYVDRDAPRGGYIDRDAPRGGYVDRDAPRGGYVDRDAPRKGDRDEYQGYAERDAPPRGGGRNRYDDDAEDDRRGRWRASRSRSRSPPRPAPPPPARDEDEDMDALRKRVADKDRTRALASGSNYALRPVGYKESLSMTVDSYVSRRRSVSPARARERARSSYHDADVARVHAPAARRSSRSPHRDAPPAAPTDGAAGARAPEVAPDPERLARMQALRERYDVGASSAAAGGGGGRSGAPSRRIGVQDRDGEDVINMRAW